MPDITLSDLIKTTENPEQAANVMGYLEEINKAVHKIDSIISTFQKWGLSPEVVEKLAIKFGGLDKVPDLPKTERPGIVAKSDMHKVIFEQLNELSIEQLQAMAGEFNRIQKEK